MKISKEEMRSRLWAEWVNGLKIVADSLAKDSLQITNSPCTMVLGNENFIQKSVMYVQRKSYIGKFKDYKSQLNAYEDTMLDLVRQVNKMLPESERIVYHSTLANIIIDGDDSFDNESWGDHAVEAYQQLCEYANGIMDTLSKAMDALDK